VPKKVEASVIPPPRDRPQSVITIGSMEAPVINHDRPIIIEETPATKQDDVPKKVDSKYLQPKWCPPGLNKTQRRKLQRARHRQQEREKLAKIEGEVVNTEQVKNPLEDRRAAAAAAIPAKPAPGPAKPAHLAVEMAEPALEAAKPASSYCCCSGSSRIG
jgi:hypothetical protein